MSTFLRTILLALLPMFAVDAAHAAAPACRSESPTFDSQAITCVIEASGTPRVHRLQANFAGGHDDTRATLAASLDGVPIDCANGSKTSLFGEDGRVSLWCDIASTDTVGRRRAFKVTVTWSHAQYVDFAFESR